MLLWFETIVVLTEQCHSKKKMCTIKVTNFIGETRKGEGICMYMYDKNAYIGKNKQKKLSLLST